jgi:hypothetical protein
MPEDPIYLPLQVGKALRPNVDLGIQTDNVGDNISFKNDTYSELTGLYWLWKNVNARYKGLVHYRRLFGTRNYTRMLYHNPYRKLAKKEEFLYLLSYRKIIVARRRNYYIESVYSHYNHTFDGKQFEAMRRVLMSTTPEYVSAWDKVMQSGGAHIYNMFVMPELLFNDYCDWMFTVIDKLVEELGPIDDPFLGRYPGRVSERLLDTWIYTNKVSYAELPIVSTEPVDWLHKGTSFLAAKFVGKKYERSF